MDKIQRVQETDTIKTHTQQISLKQIIVTQLIKKVGVIANPIEKLRSSPNYKKKKKMSFISSETERLYFYLC